MKNRMRMTTDSNGKAWFTPKSVPSKITKDVIESVAQWDRGTIIIDAELEAEKWEGEYYAKEYQKASDWYEEATERSIESMKREDAEEVYRDFLYIMEQGMRIYQ